MSTPTAPSLPDKVVQVHQAFDDGGFPHAFGGALALAYYAEPRATIDIDINVFVSVSKSGGVLSSLAALGADTAKVDRLALRRDGQARVMWDRTPLDLFFSYDPIHRAMAKAARTVPFGETSIPVLSAEHLMVCKVVFDRRKDWIDIEHMLLAVDGLDLGEVRLWLERFVGPTDPRVRHLEHAVQEILGRSAR
jgi:hypothetical protein